MLLYPHQLSFKGDLLKGEFPLYLVKQSKFQSKDHGLPSWMCSRSSVYLNSIINRLKPTSLKCTRPLRRHRLYIKDLKASLFPNFSTTTNPSKHKFFLQEISFGIPRSKSLTFFSISMSLNLFHDSKISSSILHSRNLKTIIGYTMTILLSALH